LTMFARRAAASIAAAATALPALDALVFTGGIGEHAERVRSSIVGRLGVIGVEPLPTAAGATDEPDAAGGADAHGGRSGPDRDDAARAPDASGDAVLSSPDQQVAVLRIGAREDLMIATAVEEVVAGG